MDYRDTLDVAKYSSTQVAVNLNDENREHIAKHPQVCGCLRDCMDSGFRRNDDIETGITLVVVSRAFR
jgi:hypothetical protein